MKIFLNVRNLQRWVGSSNICYSFEIHTLLWNASGKSSTWVNGFHLEQSSNMKIMFVQFARKESILKAYTSDYLEK